MLEALDLNDSEARDMQLPGPIRVDLDVQLLSVLTEKVSVDQTYTRGAFISYFYSYLGHYHGFSCTSIHCHIVMHTTFPGTTRTGESRNQYLRTSL